jgi:hypothetical protein
MLTFLFVPIAVAIRFDGQSERALKIGSFTIYSLKTPIAAAPAMSASSALVSFTMTSENRTN